MAVPNTQCPLWVSPTLSRGSTWAPLVMIDTNKRLPLYLGFSKLRKRKAINGQRYRPWKVRRSGAFDVLLGASFVAISYIRSFNEVP